MKNLFVPITVMPGNSGKSMASAGMNRIVFGKSMSKAHSTKCPDCGKNEKNCSCQHEMSGKCPDCGKNEKNCSCQHGSSKRMSKGLRKAGRGEPSIGSAVANSVSPYWQQIANAVSPYAQQASNYAAPYVQNFKTNTRNAINSAKTAYYGAIPQELAVLQNEWNKGGANASQLIPMSREYAGGTLQTVVPATSMADIGNRLKTFGMSSRVKQNQYDDMNATERAYAPIRALGEYLSPTQNLGLSMTGPAGLPRNYRTSLRDTMGVSPDTVIGGYNTPRIGGELVPRYSDADIRRMMAPARMKNDYTVRGKAVKPRSQVWNTGTMRPDVNPYENYVASKPKPTYNRGTGHWDTHIPSNIAEPVSEYERKQKAPRRDVRTMVPEKPLLSFAGFGKRMSKASNPNDPENPYRRSGSGRRLGTTGNVQENWQNGMPMGNLFNPAGRAGRRTTGNVQENWQNGMPMGNLFNPANRAARKSMSKSITSVQRSGTRHVVGGLRNGSMAKRANTSNKYFK